MPRNSSSPLSYELHGSTVHEVLSFTPQWPSHSLCPAWLSQFPVKGSLCGGPWKKHMVDMTLSRLWESASLSLKIGVSVTQCREVLRMLWSTFSNVSSLFSHHYGLCHPLHQLMVEYPAVNWLWNPGSLHYEWIGDDDLGCRKLVLTRVNICILPNMLVHTLESLPSDI